VEFSDGKKYFFDFPSAELQIEKRRKQSEQLVKHVVPGVEFFESRKQDFSLAVNVICPEKQDVMHHFLCNVIMQ
jgi:hypothetical protein